MEKHAAEHSSMMKADRWQFYLKEQEWENALQTSVWWIDRANLGRCMGYGKDRGWAQVTVGGCYESLQSSEVSVGGKPSSREFLQLLAWPWNNALCSFSTKSRRILTHFLLASEVANCEPGNGSMICPLLDFLRVALGPYVKLSIYCVGVLITPLTIVGSMNRLDSSWWLTTFHPFSEVIRSIPEVPLFLDKYPYFLIHISWNILSMDDHIIYLLMQ